MPHSRSASKCCKYQKKIPQKNKTKNLDLVWQYKCKLCIVLANSQTKNSTKEQKKHLKRTLKKVNKMCKFFSEKNLTQNKRKEIIR